MKSSIIFLALPLLWSAGCTTNTKMSLHETIGPCAGPPAAPRGDGYLVVYSCWDYGQAADYDQAARAAYTVQSKDDTQVQEVRNDAGGFDRSPVRLRLAAGEYAVSSFVPGDGLVLAPVLIQPGQTTTLYLDGSANRLKKSGHAAGLVYLPDGDVAGCNGELSGRRASLPEPSEVRGMVTRAGATPHAPLGREQPVAVLLGTSGPPVRR
jgi:hypothetical protein